MNIDKMDNIELIKLFDRILQSDNDAVKELFKKLLFLLELCGDDPMPGPVALEIDQLRLKIRSLESTIEILQNMIDEERRTRYEERNKKWRTWTSSGTQIYTLKGGNYTPSDYSTTIDYGTNT